MSFVYTSQPYTTSVVTSPVRYAPVQAPVSYVQAPVTQVHQPVIRGPVAHSTVYQSPSRTYTYSNPTTTVTSRVVEEPDTVTTRLVEEPVRESIIYSSPVRTAYTYTSPVRYSTTYF